MGETTKHGRMSSWSAGIKRAKVVVYGLSSDLTPSCSSIAERVYSKTISQRVFVNAVSATPVDWLPAKERTDGTDVALMAKEVSLFLALGPETDCV
jgi:hypothetical protein